MTGIQFQLMEVYSQPKRNEEELPTMTGFVLGDWNDPMDVKATDQEVSFKVSLPAGETFLQTWLTTATQDTIGAYYVYLERAVS